jgi:release factor glutamine methyltransferase
MFNFSIKNLLQHSTLEQEILLAKAIKKDRVFVLTHPEYRLSLNQYWRFVYYLFLLHHGYSVAAIVQHKEFFGLEFFVNKHVLIPRPETEIIVVEAIKAIDSSSEKILLIDVGTGSGCILIAILKNSKKTITTIALDISISALKVAKKNIIRHSVNIELQKSNLLNKIKDRNFADFDKIIITANLPYLTTKQVAESPSIQKEPKIALAAKENGLALYRQLFEQTKKIFPNKKNLILLEIDPSQNESIQKMATKFFPEAKLEIKKDLSDLDRTLKIST